MFLIYDCQVSFPTSICEQIFEAQNVKIASLSETKFVNHQLQQKIFLISVFICHFLQLSSQYYLLYSIFTCLFLAQHPPPQWARASSFTRFLDHTQRHTTVGRTPLDKWSARRRDLYLTTHNTDNKHPCRPVWFEPTISAGDRPQTYALDRAATGISPVQYTLVKITRHINRFSLTLFTFFSSDRNFPA